MLKAKIANKTILNNGYCEGKIFQILEIESRQEKIGRKTKNYPSQFEFIILSKGSHKEIKFHFWTGQNLNSNKFKNDETGKSEYNKLTRICLKLNLIKESDLKNLNDEILPDLSELNGRDIRFKLIESEKNNGLSIIDIDSIELIK